MGEKRHTANGLLAKARSFKKAGRWDDAASLYLEILSANPAEEEPYRDVIDFFTSQGRSEYAVKQLLRELASNPSSPQLHRCLALLLRALGKYEASAHHFRQAYSIASAASKQPVPEGSALDCGQRPKAEDPQMWEVSFCQPVRSTGWSATNDRIELARTLLSTQQRAEAIELLEMQARENPDAETLSVLGLICLHAGIYDHAEKYFKMSIDTKPDRAEAHNGLGCVYKDRTKAQKAAGCFRKALSLDPDNPHYGNNLALTVCSQGKPGQAVGLLRRVIKSSPRFLPAVDNYLLFLHSLPDMSQKELAALHRNLVRARTRPAPAPSHNNSADPSRKLRIGYISPDFRTHSAAFFFEPLLARHDGTSFDIFGYGNVAVPDMVTARLRSSFHTYRSITYLSDEAVVNLIKNDGIDILVDLAGHTANNSLSVLADKPAPVQATYLGYPGTTGMDTVDYRLTDRLADPPDRQQFYVEKLVYLPDVFLCYGPPSPSPPVSPLPARKNGYITFGSFNNSTKFNHMVLRLWARVLSAVPSSRMLLKFANGDDPETRRLILSRFAEHGIESKRISITGLKPLSDHLKLYGRVDIALDTYPYHGTTTTCEAMWMGVPVVSLVGENHASRVGLSLLSAVGLDCFAAATETAFALRAQALAHARDDLADIRKTMRMRMTKSVLCNAKAFARNVEQAYRHMWHTWCRNR